MILIPNTDKKLIQANRGDILGTTSNMGNLWSTFNIDLQDNIGAIRIGNRMKIVTKTGDTSATNLGVPVGFTQFSGKIACIAGTRVFVGGGFLNPGMTFTEDTSTSARTDYSSDTDDMCNFNGVLAALNCTQKKLYILDSFTAGTWSAATATTLDTASNGQLCYFEKFNRLYATNGKSVRSYDTSYNLSTSGNPYNLQLTSNDDDGNIQCIAAGSDRLWIGVKRGTAGGTSGNNGPVLTSAVYEWDGISNQVTKEYKIPAIGVMAIVMRKDLPIIIDTEGVLREFDGQGFKEIGRLPLHRNGSLLVSNVNGFTQNFIHPKGLSVTKDGTILALICNRNSFGYSGTETINETLPSGVWEFDGNGSAWHRNALSYMPTSSISVTDYGQNRVSKIGSIALIKLAQPSAQGISQTFVGSEYYTNASSTNSAVWIEAPFPVNLSSTPEGQKYGYFVTSWIQAENTKDTATIDAMWQKVFVKFRQFLDTGDKIVVKYRFVKAIPFEVSITWASTTTFTTSTDLTGYVGYEFEGLQGTGSGKCSHIVSAVNNAGTYTVTLDETYTGVGTSTATGRIQNWTKFGSYAAQAAQYYEAPIGKTGVRIQLKVCFQSTGDNEIHEVVVVDKPNRLAQ